MQKFLFSCVFLVAEPGRILLFCIKYHTQNAKKRIYTYSILGTIVTPNTHTIMHSFEAKLATGRGILEAYRRLPLLWIFDG